MSKARSLAKISAKGVFNISWGLAASSIISAIGVMLVAGILSESDYGLVAIALVGPNFIAIFRDWGVDWATIKYTAQYRSENKHANVKNVLASLIFFELLLGFSLSIVSFLLSGFLANTLDRPNIVPLIQIASFTIFADALLKASQAAFTGYERMEFHSISSIVYSSLKTSLMTLLVVLGFGTFGATIGLTIAYLLSGIIAIALLYVAIYKNLRKQENNKLEIRATLKTLFRYGLPLSISAIITGSLAQFYNFLIAIYCTDLIIGNYQVALNFAFIVTFFVMPVLTVLLPAFSKINSQEERPMLGNVFQFSVKYASLLIVPIAFAIIVLSQPTVAAIFGQKYSLSPLYLALYSVTFIYTVFGYLSVENLLKSQGETDFALKLTIVASAIGLSLNLVLIPAFGILGLLAANIISGIPSLIIALWWIKKKFNATIDWTSSAKILLASTIATTITFVVTSQLNLSNWITLIIGALIFLIVYLTAAPLVGAINKADIHNFKEMLKGLGPLAPLFTLPLLFIERLTRA
ncbi:MAG: oligosaccharide flippase family protein [Candidatus Bathyarchaeum sp.]|nr:MAG: oligosaccharide flippase family protein [Candidatus Bathyarchaeum sp.]